MRHPAGAVGAKIFGATSVNFMQETRRVGGLGPRLSRNQSADSDHERGLGNGSCAAGYPEQNHPNWVLLQKPNGDTTPDNVPESQGLVKDHGGSHRIVRLRSLWGC